MPCSWSCRLSTSPLWLPSNWARSSSSFRASVDLLELQAARRVAAFDRREAFYELGEHSTIDWIRTHTHVSAASADSQVTLARQLESLEPTVEAVEQGAISFDAGSRRERSPRVAQGG
jgi:hypothetical protein